MAFNFTSNAYNSFPHIAAYDQLDPTGDYTMAMWFKTSSSNVIMIGAQDQPVPNRSGWQIAVAGSGRISILHLDPPAPGGAASLTLNSTPVGNDNVLHHLIYTKTGTSPNFNIKVFYDGINTESGVMDTGPGSFSPRDLHVGADNVNGTATKFFPGILYDVRFYSRALSDGEMTTIFHAIGSDKITANLLFRMNGTEGTTGTVPVGVGSIQDLSTQSNNGDPNTSPQYIEAAVRMF